MDAILIVRAPSQLERYTVWMKRPWEEEEEEEGVVAEEDAPPPLKRLRVAERFKRSIH
jgi:hypothetical protein